MKKLSKITESIWSDIQDRSAGDVVRKEDDINLMSGEDFCDYLNDNYIRKDGHKIIYSEDSKSIYMPILKKYAGFSFSITYNYENNTINMNDEVESLCPKLCKMIKENFKVDKKYVGSTYTQFIISPSDGSECTNRFFVDVVNFIIDNADENVLSLKKKHINESIWSDIQDRSAGDTVRKEDDISLLDNEELYDYIKSKYESRIPNFNIDMGYYTNKSSNEKNLLIQPYGRWKPLMLYVFYNDGKIGEICTHFDKFKRWNFNILKQKYLLIPDRHYDECNYNFKISEKDGTITNHTVIGIIDILVEDKSKILLESIWSDIQDRSAGETVRKEDDIDHLDYEEFFVYLTEHYQPKSKKDNEKIGGRTSILATDIIEIFIPIESIDDKLKGLQINMSKKYNSIVLIAASPALFNKYVNLEKMLSNNYTLNDSRYLESKKKPTNKTVVDLIDIFLAVVDNPILEKIS